jgi:hypothetical protein
LNVKATPATKRSTLLAIVILTGLTVMVFTGCSSGTDLPAQVSGTWQRAQGDGDVEIQLVQEPSYLKVDGNSFPASIKRVDTGSYSMHLDVETGSGRREEWILRQVWNDNGSSFTLSLQHSGTVEKLVAGHTS